MEGALFADNKAKDATENVSFIKFIHFDPEGYTGLIGVTDCRLRAYRMGFLIECMVNDLFFYGHYRSMYVL